MTEPVTIEKVLAGGAEKYGRAEYADVLLHLIADSEYRWLGASERTRLDSIIGYARDDAEYLDHIAACLRRAIGAVADDDLDGAEEALEEAEDYVGYLHVDTGLQLEGRFAEAEHELYEAKSHA